MANPVSTWCTGDLVGDAVVRVTGLLHRVEERMRVSCASVGQLLLHVVLGVTALGTVSLAVAGEGIELFAASATGVEDLKGF